MNIFNANTLELLPHNLRDNPDMIAACASADASINEFALQASKIILLPNIDNITDENIVDYLAIEEHTDYYDTTLSLDKKKNIVKNSAKIHRKRGTKQAVEDLATEVFGFALVSEWFEYGGQPYNFKVDINYTALSSDNILKFIELIDSVKNARSILENIAVKINSSVNIVENIYTREIDRKTKLGIWRLGVTPFAVAGEEVQIK